MRIEERNLSVSFLSVVCEKTSSLFFECFLLEGSLKINRHLYSFGRNRKVAADRSNRAQPPKSDAACGIYYKLYERTG